MTVAEKTGSELTERRLDELCVNTIRTLSMDAVQQANSGHPGLPMGCADIGYVLWTQFLKADPSHPDWPDRDRFVLSAGHGSMLLYSLLHLTGYDLSLDDLRNFRQLGAKTAGHPEFGLVPGIECTTGPLGQGISNAVGMAIAEGWLAEKFNTPEAKVVDHATYVLASDGDLMEGVAAEAVSLAGHLKLGKLIVFYDSNKITIEGSTDLAYSDDVATRMAGYNWHVQEIDGHDHEAIAKAARAAQAETDRPSLIIARTTIAKGSPNKAGTSGSHGSPLGTEEITLTKQNMGWESEEAFFVPDAAREKFAEMGRRGAEAREAWEAAFRLAVEGDAERARLWSQCQSNEVPPALADAMPRFDVGGSIATRKASGEALSVIMDHVPNLIGGSADLAPSNSTSVKGQASLSATERGGRTIHFGIREHAMGAALNGFAYHGGVRGFGATFLVFADYMRPAIRLAALAELNPIYIFTHDSIFVGEDGPTHQPIEHLAALRAIPNLTVIRPADATETIEAWLAALENKTGPTALCLTRQNVTTLDRAACASDSGVASGGYHLCGEGELTLIATGSEVGVAIDARQILESQHGIKSRVVSLPSWEIFDAQTAEYREQVLGSGPRVAIEAGIVQGWEKYIGADGLFIGLDSFGASGPGRDLARHFGLTGEQAVADRVLPWLESLKSN